MKRIIAILLTLTLLLTLCACGEKTEEPSAPAGGETADVPTAEPAEPEATPEPEEMAYATEHGFKVVSAAEPMNYSYPSVQYADGYTDPVFNIETTNRSKFRLIGVEPLADDPDYIVYTFAGDHDCCVDFTAGEDSSEEKDAGTATLDLCFVDGNTGYRIPQKYVNYMNNDHQEYDVTVSSEGEEAAENEVTLQDILDAQGFVWNGEEVHITLLYSGDSTGYVGSKDPVENGRFHYKYSGGISDTYTVIAPAGYTGLCVGVDLSEVGTSRKEEADSGETPALALFEPEEGSNYYFQRLDEMAAPFLGVTDGAEKCASAKSVEADAEALAAVAEIKGPTWVSLNEEWIYETLDTDSVEEISTTPAETWWEYGIRGIKVAAPDLTRSEWEERGMKPLENGLCQTIILNTSTGLLIEVVAFDGEGNIVGRSGTVAPGEFITEFALDEVPTKTFTAMRTNGIVYSDTEREMYIEEKEARVGLYVYLYDLDGNLLYTGPLATQ